MITKIKKPANFLPNQNISKLQDYKLCNKCNKAKSIKDFYTHRNECKDCTKKRVREYGVVNVDMIRAYNALRRSKPDYKMQMKIYRKAWADKNKEHKRDLDKAWLKRKIIAEPWYRLFAAAAGRCYSKTHHYYKKGIKCFLSAEDVKMMWFRDKAYMMEKPSIDRIDSDGHYSLGNTRIIELKENLRLAYEKARGKKRT